MNRNNDPEYLKGLLRQCLDFWAHPDVIDMPDPDFFDDIVRATDWNPKPEVQNAWEMPEREV